PRLPGHPGRDHAVQRRVRVHQPGGRPAVCGGEPGDPAEMSQGTATMGAAAPSIRSPFAEFWRRFRRKRLPLFAGLVIVLLVLAAILAPWIAPFDPNAPDYENVLEGPTLLHLCGTDAFGRDILSRIIWGGRVSLSVGLLSVSLGGLVGVMLGLASGFFGGWI